MGFLLCDFPCLNVGCACTACGYRLKRTYDTLPRRQCAIRTPTLSQEAWSYAKAVKKWRNAGYPARTSEEIARLLAICEACPHYKTDGLRKHCGLCGCSCNAKEWGLLNKLAMATEECPAKRW